MEANEERNALAELEIELRYALHDISGKCNGETYEAVDKARRIISELAKVKDENEYPGSYDYKRACRDAYEECRVIAEEGVNNG